MPKKLRLEAGGLELEAELNETGVAKAIWEVLPISAHCNRWGEEIYFAIPVDMENENGQEVVELGDVAYWPPGRALCLFFGPTPASRGDEARAASAVTVLGRIVGDPTVLTDIQSGTEIVLKQTGND